ncbi:hypothetical protein FSI22_025645, partial [Escherichia coli]|nr:hypothetical protein [Escherichia coli]MBB9616215.1 hypothetical protein [Escherichia coli]
MPDHDKPQPPGCLLAPDLAEIRTSITDVSNEITQTVNKKLEDQSAAIQQIQKVQVDTNNNLNSM